MEQILDELCAKYWEMHLRNPVLFEEAIRNIFRLEENIDVIVEIGPHRALSRPVNEAQTLHASKQNRLYLAAMIRNTDTAMNMMRLGGALVLNGVDVNLRAVNGVKKPTQHEMQELHRLSQNLPTYSWDYSSQVWEDVYKIDGDRQK